LQPIPKTNNNTNTKTKTKNNNKTKTNNKTKNNNKTKTNNKITVVYTEDLTDPFVGVSDEMVSEEHNRAPRVFEVPQFVAVSRIRAYFKQAILHRLHCCLQFGSKTCLIHLKQRVLINLLPLALIAGW